MGDVETAAAAEVESLPVWLRSSTLAAAVLQLARRLDDGPGDREAVGLTRELRLALTDLRRLAGDGRVEEDVVARISNTALGH